MKTLLAATLIMMGSLANAGEKTLRSSCGFGGTAVPITLTDSHDEIVLCEFGLSSYIEEDTLRSSFGGFGTSAVRAYRESANDPMGQHCAFAGADVIQAQDSRGRSYQLCRFFDDSIMEERTFSRGPQSPFNRELNEALGLSW